MPMNEPVFDFHTRLNLVELLGRKARNIVELHNGIKEVSGASIYYHTHRFLQEHHYLSPEPPNDFAFWVRNALRMDALGETLSSVDTIKYHRIEDLRNAFLEILELHLQRKQNRMFQCPEGEEFHFMSCRTFVMPTRYQARNLEEFAEVLEEISIDALYWHIFESHLRFERNGNDFSNWFEFIGEKELAMELMKLDPYTMTMEGLRKAILRRIRKHVKTQ